MTFKVLTAMAIAMAMLASSPADARGKKRSYGEKTTPAPSAADKEFDAMMEKRRAAARAKSPWHHKTPFEMQFGPAKGSAILSTEKHARSAFGWTSISRKLQNRQGVVTDYSAYLGVTPKGELEGVVYATSMLASVNEKIGSEKLTAFSNLSIGATGIDETANMELGPVETADNPGMKTPIMFRRFKPSGKAYRMLGAIPDEAGISLLYGTPRGPGQMSYWAIGNKEFKHIFQVGYFKEMSKAIREAKTP